MLRYGTSSLFLLGALFMGIFFLKPAWDQFQHIRAETDHVRQLSAEFDDLIQNRDVLVAKLNSVSKEDLAKIEALIPQGPHSLEYLIGLQQLSQENGIALTFTHAEINPSPVKAGQSASSQPKILNPSEAPQKKTFISDMPVGIQVAGPYEILKAFMGHLEHFGRLTDISILAFSAPDSAQQAATFTFSLSLITHYQ